MALEMKSLSKIIPVTGGWIKRDAQTGRFVEVGTPKGVSKATEKTQSAVEEASARRKDALKRLADR